MNPECLEKPPKPRTSTSVYPRSSRISYGKAMKKKPKATEANARETKTLVRAVQTQVGGHLDVLVPQVEEDVDDQRRMPPLDFQLPLVPDSPTYTHLPPTQHTLISQKVFIKSFCKSQFPHTSVKLFFILPHSPNMCFNSNTHTLFDFSYM